MTGRRARRIQASLAIALLVMTVKVSQATVLPPGGSIALSGTTWAARPELGGVAVVDDVLPFDITGPGGVLLFQGALQARITRSDLTGKLHFSYRVRDVQAGLNGMLEWLETRDFAGSLTDVDFRLDGLGDKGPTQANRSANGSDVAFQFATEPLFSYEESLFAFVATDATAYAPGGVTTLTLTDGSSVEIATYSPVVPEPSTVVMLLSAGLVGLLVYARRRRRCGT